jgi:VIT1/CCC1 family predicted Fe2+/Mn2+ transporter
MSAEPARSPDDARMTEPHAGVGESRLNWLRAGVLGANDGIVSVAAIVAGVAGATTSATQIATAGVAGLSAGALSMAAGEYVSVSSQRDAQRAVLRQERSELAADPDSELAELAGIYEKKGLPGPLARQVAEALTAHDPLGAHAEAELGIDPNELSSPWQAAGASLLAFAVGGICPLLAILLSPAAARVAVTFAVVVITLAATGAISAHLGQAPPMRAILRNIAGGLLAMGITYAIGAGVGHTIS